MNAESMKGRVRIPKKLSMLHEIDEYGSIEFNEINLQNGFM